MANVMRSTVRAANAMTFGPDAAMSIGTGGFAGVVQPPQSARVAVEIDRAVLQIGVQFLGAREEVGDRHGFAAEVEQRRVAAADPADRATLRHFLHGRERVASAAG